MTRTFSEFLAEKTDGARWCVKSRLTDRLRRDGYTMAIPPKRFSELQVEWEREAYGAPLKSLHEAAPDLLKIVKWALRKIPDDGSGTYAGAWETVWRAEGKYGYSETPQ